MSWATELVQDSSEAMLMSWATELVQEIDMGSAFTPRTTTGHYSSKRLVAFRELDVAFLSG